MKKSSSTKKVASTTTTTTTTTSSSTKTTGNAAKTTTKAPASKTASEPKTSNVKPTTTSVPSTPKPPPTPKTPKAPATSRPSTARPSTATKPPATPKTPKPPATPKTPKAPATSRPSTARPSTAKSTTSTTSSTSTSSKTAAKKPTTTSAKPKATATKTTTTKATTSTTTTKPKTSTTSTTTKTTKASASRPSTATQPAGDTAREVSPRPPSPRPPTAGSSSSSSRPASGIPKLPTSRPSTSTTTTTTTTSTKKATTPRDTAKSPRTPRDTGSKITRVPSSDASHKIVRSPSNDSKSKSPRHNVAAIGRANTAPDLLSDDPVRPHITTGSRSVSVGGLQSNITRAAPAGRRKPTVNPVKSRQATPLREQAPRERSSAGYMNGMGLLASVGTDGPDFGQVQLRKVAEDKPKVLLIHVKGRRNVTARATEPLHKSLNKGDAFVLVDAATRRIFEWRGALANKMEIAKAMDIAGRIKNKEFGGRAEMFVLEDGKSDSHAGFWELLGGKAAVAPAEHARDDEEEDKQVRRDFLFGVIEKTAGKPELHEIARHKFNKDMLQAGQVYLVDCLTELYMWVGRGCTNSHRTLVAAKAQEALAAVRERPKWVSIVRIIEGAEPEIFKEKFCDWPSTLPITMAAVPKGNVAAKAAVKFDVASMLVSPKRDDKVFDDGSGKVEIWRVKDHTKDPVDPSMYGQFFDTESYVILYKYIVKNREVFIIYFWQGKHSSITEKGSSALLTIDLDDSIGGNATQVRVVQNKEPKHFMKLFKGFVIVHKAYETEDGASAIPETALYQIRGCNNVAGVGCDVRAVQLSSPSAKYLNTNDIFLLNTSEKQFIWRGANSSTFFNISEETLATLGSTIRGSREQVFFNEGEEPAEFWENVGEAEYYKTAWKSFPRLFHCSSASGSFKVEEVLEWDQEDLDPGHLNILDASDEIFLWTGQRASIEEEKKQAMETVLDYAKLHPDRDQSMDNVLSVNAHREPFEFKAVFMCWDDSKSKSGENGVVKVTDLLKELSRPYTLAELRNPPKMLDSTKLETYLSAEEFMNVFKMDKDAFAAQPLWKQEQQKKNVGLY